MKCSPVTYNMSLKSPALFQHPSPVSSTQHAQHPVPPDKMIKTPDVLDSRQNFSLHPSILEAMLDFKLHQFLLWPSLFVLDN